MQGLGHGRCSLNQHQANIVVQFGVMNIFQHNTFGGCCIRSVFSRAMINGRLRITLAIYDLLDLVRIGCNNHLVNVRTGLQSLDVPTHKRFTAKGFDIFKWDRFAASSDRNECYDHFIWFFLSFSR